MNHARFFRHRNLSIFIALLIVSFILMGVSQQKVTVRFKSIAYGVLYPFHFAGTKLVTTAGEFFASIKNNRQLKQELASARKRIEEYEKTQRDFEEIAKENERLRRLIGIQSEMSYDTVIAEVVAKSPQNYYKILIVNRGRNSGIKKYMPVVAYQNDRKCIIGKIIDVQKYSSRVQPLISQSSYTGAMLKESRYSGILQGQSPVSDYCLLQYIDRRAEIQFGDAVVTSGMGGVFPKGIEIGEVVSVSKKRYGIFQEAMVRPYVDFSRLEEVYIIVKSVTEDTIKLFEGQ
jgi:rod shape-determining protein MreC